MTAILLKPPILNTPKKLKLPNGLTIVAEQMPIEVINLNVWLNVGSVREADEINGMAHFLEHMVFKGTPRLDGGEFERRIEERGAVTNAATSQEYTHYYITTAPRDFRELAPLQLDVILNPSLPDNAFEREKLVVLEEIRRSEDNPRRRLFARSMETAFSRLPYRRPILGASSVIEQLTPQQMRDFHQTWYRPEQITAAIVGNLPVEEMIEQVAVAFDTLHLQEVTLPQPSKELIPEMPFTEPIRREYEDESLQQARLVMLWRVPGLQEIAQTYPLDVLAVILGQGKISRLFRELREERGLVSYISASNLTQSVQGVFYISAQLATENIEQVEGLILKHIRQLQLKPITETELARIRTQVANRFVFSNERPSDRANLYGYYQSQTGNLEVALNYPSKIQSLTIEDIQNAATRYLNTEAYASVIVSPARKSA